MSTLTRDFQRGKVYASENVLQAMYDHNPAGSVNLDGVFLQLEPEAKFASIESIQAYVDRVARMPSVVARFGKDSRVGVRERKTGHAAHYQGGEIAVHTGGTRWALRETVVLHELAHHYSRGDRHGPEFTRAYRDLLELVMGSQVSLAMQMLHHTGGVQ